MKKQIAFTFLWLCLASLSLSVIWYFSEQLTWSFWITLAIWAVDIPLVWIWNTPDETGKTSKVKGWLKRTQKKFKMKFEENKYSYVWLFVGMSTYIAILSLLDKPSVFMAIFWPIYITAGGFLLTFAVWSARRIRAKYQEEHL